MRSENPIWPGNADVITANSPAASLFAPGVSPEFAPADRQLGYVVVTENLSVDLPVSDAELTVIETYLGDILDALFEAACARQRLSGIRTHEEPQGVCHTHQPTAPGLNHGKRHRRRRLRPRS